LAVARKGGPTVEQACHFADAGRRKVREAAVRKALQMVGEAIA
jgi:nicotinamide mononucleotide (NMN) deamidase PncC